MSQWSVSVSRKIHADREKLFDIISDPKMHSVLDGSNTVKDPELKNSQKLALGDKFIMKMRLVIPYKMENEVVEYEKNSKIAWQPRLAGRFRNLIGGRIWKYELKDEDGATLVTETWDVKDDKLRHLLYRPPVIKRVKEAMEKTLENLERLAGSS